MRALTAIAAAAFAAGCSFGPLVAPACVEDADCADGQICFPDGCGDPGKGLVVEVTANSRAGQHEQDFSIDDGTLRPTYDIELKAPMTLSGEVTRHPEEGSTVDPVYLEPFTVRATGESAVIPGVNRSFQQSFTNPERGVYLMPIAAGRYTVTVTAADTSVPPVVRTGVKVENGVNASSSATFTASNGTLDITGRLIKELAPGVPPTEIALSQAPMELEAYDPVGKRPLSQRTYTSSGLTGSIGDFVMTIDPAAKLMSSIQIIARPKLATALVPTKTFTLSKPYPLGLTLLEMGDFGTPLGSVKGAVVGTDGSPVGGAAVILEGMVGGGGTFRSQPALTDAATGEFVVDLLPSPYEGSYKISIIPASKSSAGVLTAQTRAVAKPGTDPVLEPARFICPDKVGVVGSVQRPDGKGAASMVVLTATPVKSVEGRPLPVDATEVVTDDSGRFSMTLDPAVYRLDFTPGEDMPRMTRYVTVQAPQGDAAGPASTVDLGEFTLSKGRKVTGTLRWGGGSGLTGAAGSAKLRFFRLTTIDGKAGATLLGEAVTDANGSYGVILPGSGN